ncbi:MAG: sigma-54-dependent Fis family transcriptional regulator [Acidobacteria bacterium]|nr:sigma-54-dependent Fis family transcriptional regulator [Acidobacteriota bacterium]MBI3421575.1 sigma-54-dependent Fis family transcriptional regulator [Acidobacteriota bacterium]
MTSILVVDDERGARMALEVPLRLSGYDVVAASGGREALALGQQKRFDVVLTDIYMPDILGLEVVREFRRFSPDTKVIAVTAQGSLDIALQAVEAGAFDFIAKPFNIDEVLALVKRAAQPPALAQPIEAPPDFSSSGLIGHSPQMVRAYKLTAHAARSQTTVLIEGESGTGKELIARAIHRHSARSKQPFTAVNCSALPETLLEAELFGYTKGSFTGAATDKAGLFESTDGGTLFLDELGTTSPSFQASLLRVLQEKEVRRIGAAVARPVDVRIIGATNRNLEELAERGEFRADLFYRLSVLVVPLPPLRERGAEDIALLAQHFLKKYGHELRVNTDVIELLARYAWPGNVRELENTIEHAVAVCNDGVITLNDLPRRILERAAAAPLLQPKTAAPTSLIDDRPALAELERRYIQLVLAENGGNKSRTAEILNIDRRTIYRYLEPALEPAGETGLPNLPDELVS